MGLKTYFRRRAVQGFRRDFRRACAFVAALCAENIYAPDDVYVAEVYRHCKPDLVRAYRGQRRQTMAVLNASLGFLLTLGCSASVITQTDPILRIPSMLGVAGFMGLLAIGLNGLSRESRTARALNRQKIQHDLLQGRPVTTFALD